MSKQYPDDKEKICDDVENFFNRSIDQNSGDYFKAKTEIGILNDIAKYYCQVGDERKAAKFTKEAEKRKEKSSRKAL